MNIAKLKNGDESALKRFKDKEYPILDREHYGNNPPDFSPKEMTLIVKDAGAMYGFISFIVKAGIAYIDSVLVDRQHRGKGIGRRLVATAEKKARMLGAHKIWLETGASWPARRFYESLGYSTRAVLPNDVGHKDCVLMDKML